MLSPGSNGDVNQSNSATAGALAKNDNDTKQDTDQTQAGGGSGSDSTQIAGQDAANHQKADADATAVQLHPSNTATLDPGSQPGRRRQRHAVEQHDRPRGRTERQRDEAVDRPVAGERRGAGQDVGAGREKEQDGKSTGSDYTQVAGQESTSKQKADADATAVQVKPSNTAGSIRVLSPGNDGNVTQSNDATAVGIAKNDNETKQSIDQTQPGGYGSDYTQVAGQKAKNEQKADADATAVQLKPSNTASSIRVLSPGDDGDVEQSNSTTAIAAGLNDNETKQSIDQTQGSASKEKHDGTRGQGDRREGRSHGQGRLLLHADRRPGGRQRAEGRRRRDGRAVQAVELERLDPGRLEGRRRRRHAVERRDRSRDREERQRDEAVDRPDPGLGARRRRHPTPRTPRRTATRTRAAPRTRRSPARRQTRSRRRSRTRRPCR